MALTWDEYEQTGYRRPADWADRPDGPDELDVAVAEFRAVGGTVTRRDLLAVTSPDRVSTRAT
jgi:hypothetical protein